MLRRTSAAPVLCDITNVGPDGNKSGHTLEAVKETASFSRGYYESGSTCRVPVAPASSLRPVLACDVQKDEKMSEDPQECAEYRNDIFNCLADTEVMHMPRMDYMDLQVDINAKMRAILVDWLIEVHLKYKLKPDTLYLTVNLIDRVLALRQLPRKKLQLCGVTCMLIAAKFEEIYPPEVSDFVYITDNAYTRQEILHMEVMVLNALLFKICCPTVSHFMDRYQTQNCRDEAHKHLMQYLLELCLPDVKMIRYPPSHMAAAAALLSNKLLKLHPAWPQSMISLTQQTEPMIKACAREMCALLEAAERGPLQAIRKKYSQPRFSSVALLTY